MRNYTHAHAYAHEFCRVAKFTITKWRTMMRRNALKGHVYVILCMILALVLVFSFASCRNKPSKDEETSATTTQSGGDTTEDTTDGVTEDTSDGVTEDTSDGVTEDSTDKGDSSTDTTEDTTVEDTDIGGPDSTTEETTAEETTADHEHDYGEGRVTLDPTCESEGEKLYVCSVCGDEKTEKLPKLDHEMGDWEQVTAPTVNAEGLERRDCKNCDHFEERAIEKIPAVWNITVNDGMGGTLTIGVGADGVYSLTEPQRIGYAFTGWVDADGKAFSAAGTVNSNVTVTATWEIDATETLDELIERAAAGVDYIYLTKDIVIDRTVYFTGQTVIYSDGAVKLIRAADFAGDMIVVGQDESGKHYVLKNGVAELVLGKPDGSSDITIDGNRDNVTVSVNGSAICLVNSSILKTYDGISIVNNKKVGNERVHAYADKFGNTYPVGGAAVLITSGSFDMYGGLIANNSVNLEDIGNEADGTTLLSAYGGAIYNFGTFNMYGGTIRDNEANRGGAIFTKKTVRIYAGVIEGNRATNKGGAIATSESPYAEVFLGSCGAADDTVIFRNNVADIHGGAYLGYYRTPLMALGGVTFEGNRAEGSVGGAISTAGPVILEDTRFIGNYAYQSGGAIYQNYIGEDTTTNEVYLTDCYFEGNEAGRGGVILLSAAEDEPKAATKVYITGCTFKENEAVQRVEENLNESTGEVIVKKSYGYGGVIYATKKTNIVIKDSAFESNSASVSAGAMYLTTDTVVTVKNTHFESNSSTTYGGAIYAVASNKLTLDTVTFKNNGGISEGAYLTERGGALYVGEATVTTKSCTFEGNTASIGGALYVSGTGSYSDGDTKNISGAASTFKSNTSDKGGAACVYGSAKFCGSRFNDNVSGQNGGAAYAGTDARLSFVGCSFEGNRATLGSSGVKRFGGAVYAVSATLDIEDSTFQNNGFLTPEGVSGSKTYGGAVGASDAATVSVKNSKLENNTAQYGGAIAVYSLEGNSFTASGVTVTGNSSTNCGGAMYINEATATITGLVATGNESRSGGALYISECEELSIGGNSLFEANIATANGGAIFVGEQATLGDSSSAFKGNTATKGGAIYVNSSTATDATTGESVTYRGKITLENSNFTENSASLNDTDSRGGAIFVAGGVVEANGVGFSGNTATLYGGAICAESSSEMTLTDTVFEGNLSGGNGGALWTYFDSSTVICGIVAKGNRSQEGTGGFIYTRGDLEIKTDGERENIFGGSAEGEGNSAVSGGVIYVNGPEEDGKTSKMNISSASFIGNEASESGGAFYFIRSDADIERSSFEGNSAVKYAGAIELLNSSASIKASSFINNTAQTSGGAVYATQTPAEREIVTLGCTFTGNSSDGTGGAIYLTGTAIYRDGDEMVPLASTFENNASANGGAICAYGAVTLYETDFDGNRSSGNGGAITSAGTLKLYECGFTGNGTEGAEANGGALYLSGAVAEINACEFADNSADYRGGAVYATQTPAEREIVTLGCSFTGNSSDGTGGAIYLTGTAIYRDGDEMVPLASTFENNASANGGAICAYGAVTLYETDFDGNRSSGNGGAITSAGTLKLYECGFTGNGTEGAEANGGALYLSGAVAEINACEFADNSADYRGGAIYVTSTPEGAEIVTEGCVFDGNKSANHGGALYLTGTATYRDGAEGGDSASAFISNGSAADGGAICAYGTVTLYGTYFNGNSSSGNGGAIACASELDLNSCEFVGNNTASTEANGGALYLSGAVAEINACEFADNSADYRGGAIYITGAPESAAININGSNFEGNQAVNNGGAIYIIENGANSEVVTALCTFDGNEAAGNGGAIYLAGTGIYRDGNEDGTGASVFTNNTASGNGGAIGSYGKVTLYGTSFDGNSAVGGGAAYAAGASTLCDVTFTNNTASGNGGALIAADEIVLDGCEFTGNLATKSGSSNGGALYLSGAFGEISDCSFEGNGAAYRGGAIYVTQTKSGEEVVTTGCTFDGNTAENHGGALYLTGTATYRDGTVGGGDASTFKDNSSATDGGAIYVYGSAELCGTTFEGNEAANGGAIAVNVTTVSGGYSAGKVTLNGAALTSNTATADGDENGGGAIYIYAGGTLEDNGSTFTSNEAFKGGAIYAAAEDGSLKATVTLVGTTASKNVATKYGAVCIYNGAEFSADNCSFTENNNTTSNGGAIFIYGADAEIKNSVFTGNTAAGSGAAIYLTATPTGAEVVTIDCTFTGNKATTNGGAVYITGTGIYRDGDKDADNGSTFDANEAASGGAVCAYGAAELYGSSLKNNTTTGHGGAVTVAGTDTASGTLVVDSSEFIGNKTTGSSSNGGAIYVSRSYATVSNTTFDGNKAGYRGGAIYATSTPEGKAVLTDNCTFKNNSAANNGGAVYLTGTAIVSDNGSTFTGNQAASGGAIMNYGKLTLVGTTITGNASGVNVAGGTLGVSGDVVVKDNTSYDVNLAKNMVITVTGELTEGALIGFTTTTADAGFAVADGVNVTDISGYADYFVSSDGVPVYADENGNLVRGYVIFSEPSRFNGFVYSVSGKPTFTWYEYVDGQKGAVVAGQTTNTLSGVEALKTYVCVVTYADGTTFESVPVTYAERQYHLECGGAVCDCAAGHTESIVWIPITSIDELQESVKLGGYYYLACDLELTSALTLEADVAICLNGKILSRADGAGNLIKVEGYELTLTDCSETERVGHIDPATSLWTEGAYTGDGTALAVTLKGGIVMGGNASYGGAIYVKTGSLTAYGINIINNISSTEGGAIYAHTSNVTLVGVSFVANSSGKGGAIYTTDPDSTGKILITKDCSFISNSASGNGGAVYLTGTAVYNDDGSSFKSNSAASGGAIYASGVAEISGATFTDNTSTGHGGAIVAAKEINLYGCTFEGNTATTSGTANGGALYISGAFAEIEGCSFKDNGAGYRGGAIYVTSTPADAEVVTKSCIFEGNSVSSNIGGAVYLTGTAIYRDGDADSNNGSTFKNNSAANGGALGSYGTATLNGTKFESNEATARGGAIYVAGKTVTVNGATFNSNVATTSGGAIYATASTLNVNNSTFEGNSATTSGGAICVEKTNATLNVVGGTYKENKVTSTATGTYTNMGGAIAIGASTTASISGNAIFTSNSGCASGGAVAAYGSGATLTVNGATFEGNNAGNGGAIYAGGASVTTIKAMTAKGNKATSLGAIVYVTSANTKLTLEGAVIYDNNTAKDISCGFIHLANATAVVDIYKGNVTMLSSADATEVTITDWTDLLLNPKSGTINELS